MGGVDGARYPPGPPGGSGLFRDCNGGGCRSRIELVAWNDRQREDPRTRSSWSNGWDCGAGLGRRACARAPE
jgi:hypothetical protein